MQMMSGQNIYTKYIWLFVDFQNLTYWPANSTERRHKNDYYLGIYGAFGVGQGQLFSSFTNFCL
jgi:hypothetical protein